MDKPGLAPRRAAFYLLGQVTGEGRLLSDLLPKAVEHLSPEERARAQRLATDTLRWMDRADRMLGPHLKKRPPLEALNVLRLGVVEMALDGAAPHGVVDAAVTIMRKSQKTAKLSGLVNAVLRRVSENLPKWQALPDPRLPKWLRSPLIAGYSKAEVATMETAHSKGAPLDISVKSDAAGWAEKLGGVVLPTGSVRLANAGQVTALEGYAGGDWWVQDAAAAIPAQVLQATKGEAVLDLCCAPGGKTMQMAASGAQVTAVDMSGPRLARVQENLDRTKLHAELVKTDATKWEPDAQFDAILLDAPCSATGTIRRHPDLPYAKDGAEFAALFELQETLIDKAVHMLRPGGRLVFCTCSLLPDEGEAQIEEALARHNHLGLDLDSLKIDGVADAWINDMGLRLRPDYWADLGGMDGFFVSVLRKAA